MLSKGGILKGEMLSPFIGAVSFPAEGIGILRENHQGFPLKENIQSEARIFLDMYLERLIDYEKLTHYNYKSAYSLERVEELLELLGNPHKRFPSVVISGTKGKGSTAAILASILTAAGRKTGLFTSPHLVSLRERIKIGTSPISAGQFKKNLSLIKNAVEASGLKGLTFFEVLTGAAFLYFADRKIDVAVLEVGLGGRLDAVNVVDQILSVMTPISYDHTQLLGKSIRAIAKEKCGIVKRAVPLVSAPQTEEAEQVIRSAAVRKGSELFFTGKDIDYKNLKISASGTSFDARIGRRRYKDLHMPLIGRHQAENALAAITAAGIAGERSGLKIRESDVRNGLSRVKLAGRFQIFSKGPYLILDGAHNRASAQALSDTFKRLFGKVSVLVFGISSDKDIEGVARILCPLADSVIFTNADSQRAEPGAALARRLKGFCRDCYTAPDIKDALTFAKAISGMKDVILVTGSFFLVGEALKHLGAKTGKL